ncbi:MAG: S8 family peptidase, partial [Patescibacteria group bacterium]|nr:S8 family peptidase [Patescibacteria group bacterium]
MNNDLRFRTFWQHVFFGVQCAIIVCLIGIAVIPGSAQALATSQPREIVVKTVGSETLHVISLAPDENTAILLGHLQDDPAIDFAVPNYQYTMALEPNDEYYSSQWYLSKVDAPVAWDYSTGAHEVTVAVLDSGVDLDHPDLRGVMWRNSDEIAGNDVDDDHNGYIDDVSGWDFTADTPDPQPTFDQGWTESGIHHGTAVAGVIGAIGNNGEGIAGLTWSTRIMSVRVLDGAGVGNTKDVYSGILYAIENGADLVNLSFVGSNNDSLLETAIQAATDAGVLVFAAAGNEGININTSPRYPACSAGVIGVGGTTSTDRRLVLYSGDTVTGGSNYGSHCVDISAPGSDFFSTIVYDPDHGLNDYYRGGWSGTSVASPMVAGAAALLKAYDSLLTNAEIINRLNNSAVPINYSGAAPEGSLGSGRLNFDAAVFTAVETTITDRIVAGAGPTGGPQIRLFKKTGEVEFQFFAYAESFRGGVNVAAGDIN